MWCPVTDLYIYLDGGLLSLSIDQMWAPQTQLSCPACITLTHARQPNLSSVRKFQFVSLTHSPDSAYNIHNNNFNQRQSLNIRSIVLHEISFNSRTLLLITHSVIRNFFRPISKITILWLSLPRMACLSSTTVNQPISQSHPHLRRLTTPQHGISLQGHRNRSGRPGACRTNNLTYTNFYVHIISTFVNVNWFSGQLVYLMPRDVRF